MPQITFIFAPLTWINKLNTNTNNKKKKKKTENYNLAESETETVPPADIPETNPKASKNPITKNRHFGIASISFVTIPNRYRMYKMLKYITTYLNHKNN